MDTFEIHGDSENGITVRIGQYEQTFDLIHWQQTYNSPLEIRFENGRSFPVADLVRLALDMKRRPEVLDATPNTYGEGTWLH